MKIIALAIYKQYNAYGDSLEPGDPECEKIDAALQVADNKNPEEAIDELYEAYYDYRNNGGVFDNDAPWKDKIDAALKEFAKTGILVPVKSAPADAESFEISMGEDSEEEYEYDEYDEDDE